MLIILSIRYRQIIWLYYRWSAFCLFQNITAGYCFCKDVFFYIWIHTLFFWWNTFSQRPDRQEGKTYIYSFVSFQMIPSDVLLPVFGERCFSGKPKIKKNERRNLMSKILDELLSAAVLSAIVYLCLYSLVF